MPHGREAVERTAPQDTAADLVLYGGTVLTMDKLNRQAEALAIRHGRVQATGSNRDLLKLAGPQTVLFDLAGRVALPGFIETHSHPMEVGDKLRRNIDAGTPPNDTIDDILERIREKARCTPEGEWILGEGYDDTLLRDNRHPTRRDLDRVAPRHPVYLQHISGHLSVANSLALLRGGVTRDTPTPSGSQIFRDDRGEPTGVLAEPAAQSLVSRQLPPTTVEEIIANLAIASREYLTAGITSAHDLGVGWKTGAAEITAYRKAVERKAFRQRCYAFMTEEVLPKENDGHLVPLAAAIAGLGDERFRLGAAKLFADGSIQGLTGALSQPYKNAPESRGLELNTREELSRKVRVLTEAGWHVGIHGNGDAAIQNIIEAYAGAKPVDEDVRYRIEHCQMVREDQLDRMRDLGIVASFFVKHVYYWGDRHRDMFIGPERAQRISPLRSAQERGIRFALHSDCPVTPVSPLEGIWAAVNRITRQGKVLGPEQRIDVVTALRAYTSDAAYLSFEENVKGTLEPGKFADVTVLSENPTRVPPGKLKDLRVEATIVDGETAWDRSSGQGTQIG